MDEERFDRLVRAITTAGTRRKALKSLLGGAAASALGAAGLAETEAKQRKHKKHKTQSNNQQSQDQAASAHHKKHHRGNGSANQPADGGNATSKPDAGAPPAAADPGTENQAGKGKHNGKGHKKHHHPNGANDQPGSTPDPTAPAPGTTPTAPDPNAGSQGGNGKRKKGKGKHHGQKAAPTTCTPPAPCDPNECEECKNDACQSSCTGNTTCNGEGVCVTNGSTCSGSQTAICHCPHEDPKKCNISCVGTSACGGHSNHNIDCVCGTDSCGSNLRQLPACEASTCSNVSGAVCHPKTCTDPTKDCDQLPCQTASCAKGVCSYTITPNVACTSGGNAGCCNSSGICDTSHGACCATPLCNGVCCGSGETCQSGICCAGTVIGGQCCPSARVCTGGGQTTCCANGQSCDTTHGTCCAALCGGVCCDSGATCVNDTCCATGQICGANKDICCPSGQTCVNNACSGCTPKTCTLGYYKQKCSGSAKLTAANSFPSQCPSAAGHNCGTTLAQALKKTGKDVICAQIAAAILNLGLGCFTYADVTQICKATNAQLDAANNLGDGLCPSGKKCYLG